MNIKEYISSGMVESYVLGLANEQDKLEFEQLSKQYPELVAAREAFEVVLENKCLSEAVNPPQNIREGIMNAIQLNTPINQSKIIEMENSYTTRNSSPMRWVAAASVILLLASAYFAYNFYDKNKTLESELSKTKNQQAQLDTRLQKMEDQQKMISDPNVSVVNLVGTQKAPKSSVNVYWDSTSANVYLVVKNMPKLPTDKQYQLWALIGKDPKDLGLFDVGEDGKVILKMNNTQKADAFAITVEKRGNSGGPNLDELQTMGKPTL